MLATITILLRWQSYNLFFPFICFPFIWILLLYILRSFLFFMLRPTSPQALSSYISQGLPMNIKNGDLQNIFLFAWLYFCTCHNYYAYNHMFDVKAIQYSLPLSPCYLFFFNQKRVYSGSQPSGCNYKPQASANIPQANTSMKIMT
jgi:hypothetical protein